MEITVHCVLGIKAQDNSKLDDVWRSARFRRSKSPKQKMKTCKKCILAQQWFCLCMIWNSSVQGLARWWQPNIPFPQLSYDRPFESLLEKRVVFEPSKNGRVVMLIWATTRHHFTTYASNNTKPSDTHYICYTLW